MSQFVTKHVQAGRSAPARHESFDRSPKVDRKCKRRSFAHVVSIQDFNCWTSVHCVSQLGGRHDEPCRGLLRAPLRRLQLGDRQPTLAWKAGLTMCSPQASGFIFHGSFPLGTFSNFLTYLVGANGGCYWHLVGRPGMLLSTYSTQDGPQEG